MAKTDWTLSDTVKPDDFNNIGREINQLRKDVDHIEVPTASLTEAGIVQLSNATNSTSEAEASTSKATKTAYDTAVAAQNTANAANTAAAAAQAKANAAETPSGAQVKVNAAVGPLSSLLTSAKDNTVSAINELFTSASNGKTAVAAAITGKGVPASGSDTFGQLATKIRSISTSTYGSIPRQPEQSDFLNRNGERRDRTIATLPASKGIYIIPYLTLSCDSYTVPREASIQLSLKNTSTNKTINLGITGGVTGSSFRLVIYNMIIDTADGGSYVKELSYPNYSNTREAISLNDFTLDAPIDLIFTYYIRDTDYRYFRWSVDKISYA